MCVCPAISKRRGSKSNSFPSRSMILFTRDNANAVWSNIGRLSGATVLVLCRKLIRFLNRIFLLEDLPQYRDIEIEVDSMSNAQSFPISTASPSTLLVSCSYVSSETRVSFAQPRQPCCKCLPQSHRRTFQVPHTFTVEWIGCGNPTSISSHRKHILMEFG